MAASGSDRFRAGCIREVYLFDAERVRDEQDARGVKTGVASSVLRRQWDDAEIYPHDRNPLLRVTPHQVELLQLLSG